jgi:hypothetical protein
VCDQPAVRALLVKGPRLTCFQKEGLTPSCTSKLRGWLRRVFVVDISHQVLNSNLFGVDINAET